MNNIKVIVNGDILECGKSSSIEDIIKILKVENQSIVAEVNGKILSKDEFSSYIVTDGEKIELIRFVGGG